MPGANPCKNSAICNNTWVNDDYVAKCTCLTNTFGQFCESELPQTSTRPGACPPLTPSSPLSRPKSPSAQCHTMSFECDVIHAAGRRRRRMGKAAFCANRSVSAWPRASDVDKHNDCVDQPCCSQGGYCIDFFKDAICVSSPTAPRLRAMVPRTVVRAVPSITRECCADVKLKASARPAS